MVYHPTKLDNQFSESNLQQGVRFSHKVHIVDGSRRSACVRGRVEDCIAKLTASFHSSIDLAACLDSSSCVIRPDKLHQ